MNKIYHVCSNWNGCDLLSLYNLCGQETNEARAVFHRRWPKAKSLSHHHIYYVHCFNMLRKAKKYQSINGGEILSIDVGQVDIELDCFEDRHPMVYGLIEHEKIRRI